MKKRCDGGTPCKHCHIAIGGPLECEYVGPGGQSESQILEQDIARLEQRIYDLEHPEEYEANLVLLHMPYVSGSSQTPSNSQGKLEFIRRGRRNDLLCQCFTRISRPDGSVHTSQKVHKISFFDTGHRLSCNTSPFLASSSTKISFDSLS